MDDLISAVEGTALFQRLSEEHSGVTVWQDHENPDHEWTYFWILIDDGGAVRNLAYVRWTRSSFQRRTYGVDSEEVWMDSH